MFIALRRFLLSNIAFINNFLFGVSFFYIFAALFGVLPLGRLTTLKDKQETLWGVSVARRRKAQRSIL